MDEDAGRAVRSKKDSSLVRAAEAVRDGQASAMVSAGNTGATMASALLRMGRIKGVSRPAIATPIPVPGGNADRAARRRRQRRVQPEWLVQFAQMGSVFARHRFGIADAAGRPAVDRRGARQGRPAAQGGATSCCGGRADRRRRLHRQRRGPRPHDRRRRRGRHRRVHRQRRAEDARRRHEGASSARCSRRSDRRPSTRQHADALLPALLPLYADARPRHLRRGDAARRRRRVHHQPRLARAQRAMLNGINVAHEMVEADVVGEISRAIRPATRRRPGLTVTPLAYNGGMIFQSHCAGCDRVGPVLCRTCRFALARPSSLPSSRDVIAAVPFTGRARDVLLGFKYGNRRQLSHHLAGLLVNRLLAAGVRPADLDVVTWAPTSAQPAVPPRVRPGRGGRPPGGCASSGCRAGACSSATTTAHRRPAATRVHRLHGPVFRAAPALPVGAVLVVDDVVTTGVDAAVGRGCAARGGGAVGAAGGGRHDAGTGRRDARAVAACSAA